MALRPTKNSRERVLLFGGAGTGKSHSVLSIASRAQQTGSEAKFYIMDTDASMDRMLEEEFPELTNVEWAPVFDWPDYTDSLDMFMNKATPDDFIIVDMITPAWEAVQEYYIQRIFGKDVDEFFMEARKSLKKGTPLDGYRDWGTINKLYRSWVTKLIFKSKCHIIATAAIDQVSDNDDKQLRVTFGPYGVKPRGQKHLSHQFHTVLLTQCRVPREEHTLTTIKDRGREVLTNEKVKDFCLSYLVGKAGWKL